MVVGGGSNSRPTTESAMRIRQMLLESQANSSNNNVSYMNQQKSFNLNNSNLIGGSMMK